MKFQRMASLVLVAFLFVPLCCMSVSAAEIYKFEFFDPPAMMSDADITFPYYPDYGALVADVFVPEGLYHVSGVIYGKEFEFLSDVSIQWVLEEAERNIYVVLAEELDCKYDGSIVLCNFYMEGSPDMSISVGFPTFIWDYDSEFHESDFIIMERVGPLPNRGGLQFMDNVSDALDTSIEWVGKVTTSLLSGELNGLLLLAAIPIAISIVLLTVKIIKKNSWGV